jgi:hypothetical protein
MPVNREFVQGAAHYAFEWVALTHKSLIMDAIDVL